MSNAFMPVSSIYGLKTFFSVNQFSPVMNMLELWIND